MKPIQYAIITDCSIYGIGDTPQAARADALEWLDKREHDDTDLDQYLDSGEMGLVQITDELAQKVISHGGDIAFEVTSEIAHSPIGNTP